MSNEITLNLGFLTYSRSWKPDNREKEAAWELYVELVTRVTIIDLPNYALLREALSSLYSIFKTTREILRKYGSKIAVSKKSKNNLSFGIIAVTLLNEVLRPFLSKWHPLLLDYEKTKPDNISPLKHEQEWSEGEQIMEDLEKVRDQITELAELLEQAIGIPSLTKMENNLIRHDNS